MKQQMVAIKYNSVSEMKAIRAVMEDFGYSIYESFKHATTMGEFRYVRIDRSNAHRGCCTPSFTKLTLQEFIDREAKDVRSDAHTKIEGIERSLQELTKQLAELKASI